MKLGAFSAGAASLLMLASVSSHARSVQIEKHEVRLQMQTMRWVATDRPLRVQMTTSVRPDGCNRTWLDGKFRRIESISGGYQTFFADFMVMTTAAFCPSRTPLPVETLKSPIFEVQPTDYVVNAIFYFPPEISLSVVEEP